LNLGIRDAGALQPQSVQIDEVHQQSPGGGLSRDELGISTRTIQRLLKRVANRARITAPVTPHVLRHTFAVNAVRRGISLSTLQKILGHDRLSTTEIYLNLSPEQVMEEFQRKW